MIVRDVAWAVQFIDQLFDRGLSQEEIEALPEFRLAFDVLHEEGAKILTRKTSIGLLQR